MMRLATAIPIVQAGVCRQVMWMPPTNCKSKSLSKDALSAIGQAVRLWRKFQIIEKMCTQTLQIYQSVIRDYHGA